ncbi:MAG: radical SAM protein [Candidatus Woesearchaeota archaeon]
MIINDYKYVKRGKNINWITYGFNYRFYIRCGYRANKIKILELNESAFFLWLILDEKKTLKENHGSLRRKEILLSFNDYLKFLDSISPLIKIVDEKGVGDDYEKYYPDLKYNSKPRVKLIFDKAIPKHRHFMDWDRQIKKKYMLGSEPKRFYLSNMTLDITYNCNLDCKLCIIDKKIRHSSIKPDKNKVKEIIDKIAKSNTKIVTISGGEPFSDPNIIDYIKFAKSKGLEVDILTNGHPKIIEYIDFLADENIDLYFGVCGYDFGQTEMRGEKSSSNLIKIIDECNRNGLRVNISYTFTKQQSFDALNTFLKFSRHKLNFFKFRKFTGIRNFYDKPDISKEYETSILQKLFTIASYGFVKLFSKFNIQIGNMFTETECAAKHSLNIDYNGDVYPCIFSPRDFKLGNVFEKSILDIWNSKEYNSYFANLDEPCKSCIFIKTCNKHPGCIASNFAHDKNRISGNTICTRGKISEKIQFWK